MKAKWIAPLKSNTYHLWNFKKEFDIENINGECWVNVTAYGYYKLFINGHFINAGPCKSFDYEKSYDSIDVTEYMHNGRNHIAVISMHLEHIGILLDLQINGEAVAVTDDSWKVKRNMCFEEKTLGNCAPLEPISATEEHYDNRKNEIWLNENCDFSNWDNAVITGDGEFSNPNMGGLLTNDITLPQAVLAVCEYDNKQGYYFRLGSESAVTDAVSKQSLNAYMTVLTADEDTEAVINSMLYIDGQLSGPSVKLSKGEHFIISIGYWGGHELFFETDKHLSFSASKIKAELNTEWCVLNLDAARKYFAAWAGMSDVNESSAKALESICGCTSYKELPPDVTDKLKTADVLDVSVGFLAHHKNYYAGSNSFIKPDLKFNPSKSNGKCIISDTRNFLHTNQLYTKISKGDREGVCIVVDFGVVKLGYVTFSLYAEAGTVIDFENFELINPDGIRHNPNACLRYICSEGYQTYTAFLPRGLRYMAIYISNFTEDVKLKYIGVNEAICTTGAVAQFQCDDYKLNSVFKMCTDSVLKCMSDTYVDCPGYEQVYWTGDAKVTSEVNLLCFGRYDYDYNCLKLIGESMSEKYKEVYRKGNKMYEENKYLVLPSYGTYVDGGLPMWSFLWVFQIYENYMYSGNKEHLMSLYPQMKKMLENCEGMMSSRYLFSMDGAWNLIEWADNDLLCCGEVTASTALLAKCCTIAADLAQICEDTAMIDVYLKRAEKMKAAINKYCWNDEKQGYIDCPRDAESYKIYRDFFETHYMQCDSFEGYQKRERVSQQTNTIVYICDCADKERENRCKDIIRLAEAGDYKQGSPSAPKSSDDIVKIGSPFFLYFTFKALSKMGETAIMQKIMTRDYGKMLDNGTNTCWEHFQKSDTEWTRSICHAWGASPAIYLLQHICGINAAAAGFKQFTFKPDIGSLNWVKASVATPYGPIYVHIDKNKNICDINYPDECELIKN